MENTSEGVKDPDFSTLQIQKKKVSKTNWTLTKRFTTWPRRLKLKGFFKRTDGRHEKSFGRNLIDLQKESGRDVPRFVAKCIECIEKHDNKTNIYGTSGVVSQIETVRSEIDKGKKSI